MDRPVKLIISFFTIMVLTSGLVSCGGSSGGVSDAVPDETTMWDSMKWDQDTWE